MADDADRASELEEQHRQQAYAQRTRFAGVSLEACQDCDADIPEARRTAIPGVALCVECQGFAERMQR